MISFDNFVPDGMSPLYLQIVLHIKRGIASGEVRDRDEMPSRRVLSALLGVNPNTVQKAYHMLEQEGLIESRPGAGSHITAGAEKTDEIKRLLARRETAAFVTAVKKTGLTKDEVISLINELWNKE